MINYQFGRLADFALFGSLKYSNLFTALTMELSRAMKAILVSLEMFMYLLIFLSSRDGPEFIYCTVMKVLHVRPSV